MFVTNSKGIAINTSKAETWWAEWKT